MYKEYMTLDGPHVCSDCVYRGYAMVEDEQTCTKNHHPIRLWGTCEDFELTNQEHSV